GGGAGRAGGGAGVSAIMCLSGALSETAGSMPLVVRALSGERRPDRCEVLPGPGHLARGLALAGCPSSAFCLAVSVAHTRSYDCEINRRISLPGTSASSVTLIQKRRSRWERCPTPEYCSRSIVARWGSHFRMMYSLPRRDRIAKIFPATLY